MYICTLYACPSCHNCSINYLTSDKKVLFYSMAGNLQASKDIVLKKMNIKNMQAI